MARTLPLELQIISRRRWLPWPTDAGVERVTDTLECPGSGSNAPNWAQELYLYRASDINSRRPIFTGDVFFDVEVQGVGAIEQKNVIVIQHPCALRSNGIDLTDTLMLAEVVPHRLLQPSEWTGFARL